MDSDEDDLCLVFVPSLVATLLNKEREKGEPLTEEEVLQIRDSANCVVVTFDQGTALDASRGYEDIIAEDAWNEWQRVRVEFLENEDE